MINFLIYEAVHMDTGTMLWGVTDDVYLKDYGFFSTEQKAKDFIEEQRRQDA